MTPNTPNFTSHKISPSSGNQELSVSRHPFTNLKLVLQLIFEILIHAVSTY